MYVSQIKRGPIRSFCPGRRRHGFYAIEEQRYLGDDEFLDRVDRKINNEPRPKQIDLAKSEVAICRPFEFPVNLLRSRSKERRGSFGRALVPQVNAGIGWGRA